MWDVSRRLTVDRSLTAQLLKHLRSTGQSITRLADTDVEHELLDAQLAHGVGALVLSFRLHYLLESPDSHGESFLLAQNRGAMTVVVVIMMLENIPWRLLLALNWSTR